MNTSAAFPAWCVLAFLLAAPAMAQDRPDANVEVKIAPGATLERAFPVRNQMDCPRDTYRFSLTSDTDFVSLPDETIELSRSRGTDVRVVFASGELDPGTYFTNITFECRNCTNCRSSDKVMRVAMTVTAPPAEAIVEIPDEATRTDTEFLFPDLSGSTLAGAEEELLRLGLQPVVEGAEIERRELLTVTGQRPAAGESVATGERVTLIAGVPVPDLSGLTTDAAQRRLAEVGLSLTSSGAGTTVGSQLPAAGAIVAIGTTINVVLAVLDGPNASRNWLTVLTLLAVVILAIYFWRASARTAAAPVASFNVRSNWDAGTHKVWSDSREVQRPVVRVRLSGVDGEQTVHGDPASTTEKEQR